MESIIGIKWDKLPGNHHVLRLIYPGGIYVVEFDEAKRRDLVASAPWDIVAVYKVM